jgi:hypothetical protein
MNYSRLIQGVWPPRNKYNLDIFFYEITYVDELIYKVILLEYIYIYIYIYLIILKVFR